MVLTVSENWTDTTPVEMVVNVYTEPSTETGITPQTPPATTTQSLSTLSQSSSTQSQPCSPTITMIGLPTYNDYVTAKLRTGDSHLVWSKMICEAAHYYLANYPQMGLNNSPSDCRKVGQAMFKHFPTIARDGTQPWVRHLLSAIAYDGEILCRNNETTKLCCFGFSHMTTFHILKKWL